MEHDLGQIIQIAEQKCRESGIRKHVMRVKSVCYLPIQFESSIDIVVQKEWMNTTENRWRFHILQPNMNYEAMPFILWLALKGWEFHSSSSEVTGLVKLNN